MKVAIPVLVKEPPEESQLFGHFGRATHYAIIDLEEKSFQIVNNDSDHFGGYLSPPEFLHKLGIDAVLVEGMGGRAFDKFKILGVRVFRPKKPLTTIKELLEAPHEWIEVTKSEETEIHKHEKNGKEHDCEKQ